MAFLRDGGGVHRILARRVSPRLPMFARVPEIRAKHCERGK